ncbi:hypothetical protein CEXT_363491 [Caerostris extrusa]|uniref:Uncharacterized protein n=1 Tax=Caerostris extrusa TaxID=172846 RepID=A0AAV4STP9_CAEEX|nr:hypothetical protein CEXT_363491 [Caerostris extrusa]
MSSRDEKGEIKNHTFKELSNSGRGQAPLNFHQAHNSGNIRFQQTPVHLQQTWNSGKNQFQKQNLTSIRATHSPEKEFYPIPESVLQPEKKFLSPGTSKRRKINKSEWWKKKKTGKEVEPLFSFQRTPVKIERQFIDIETEDDDDDSPSVCSSEGSFWTTNISNDEMDNFSDESEVSMISSIKDNEFSEDIGLGISSNQTGIISVFWDIENCPVPRKNLQLIL